MSAGTLVSRVLGFIRSPLLLGAVLGINFPSANAFDIATRVPNLIYMLLIGGVVNAVLVPAIVRAMKDSEDDGAAYVNKLITVTIVLMGGIALLLTLASPIVVHIFASTMDPGWISITTALTYWCMPQIFFYGLYTVFGQVLNARENFGPYMWAPVINNVVAIIGISLMLYFYGFSTSSSGLDTSVWTWDRVALIGGSSTLGIASQAAILLYTMKRLGIRLRLDFHWKGAGLRSAATSSLWVSASLLISFIPVILLTNAATGATHKAIAEGKNVLEVAGNAAYTSAFLVNALPNSIIVVSIVTAIFPQLSKLAAAGDLRNLRETVAKTLRIVALPMCLCTAGLIVLAVPGMRILAATVSFTEVIAIAHVLSCLAVGILALGSTSVLTRVFYAFEDTHTWFYLYLPTQIFFVVGYVISGWLLPSNWVVMGVALTQALGNWLWFLVMYYSLTKRFQAAQRAEKASGNAPISRYRLLKPEVEDPVTLSNCFPQVPKTYIRLFLLSFLTMLVGLGITYIFGVYSDSLRIGKSLVTVIIVGGLMTFLYVWLLKATESPEWTWFIRSLKRRSRRP